MIVAGIVLLAVGSVICEEKTEKKADEKAVEPAGGAEKKQDKRGIFGEGFHDFEDHGGWDIGHDDHHIHHHHEKTIYNVKKVPVPYAYVFFTIISIVHYHNFFFRLNFTALRNISQFQYTKPYIIQLKVIITFFFFKL